MYLIFLFLICYFAIIYELADDLRNRCRWSILSGEPIIYIKYDRELNIIDTEKKALILKDSVKLGPRTLENI